MSRTGERQNAIPTGQSLLLCGKRLLYTWVSSGETFTQTRNCKVVEHINKIAGPGVEKGRIGPLTINPKSFARPSRMAGC